MMDSIKKIPVLKVAFMTEEKKSSPFLLLKTLWDICLFRKGPQEVSYSPPLFVGLLMLSGLIHGFILSNQYSWVRTLSMSIVSLAIPLGWVYLLLRIRHLEARWLQTMVGLYGTNLLLSFLALGSVLLAVSLQFLFSLQWMVLVITFFFGGWMLLVAGHVLRHALNCAFWVGLLFAFGMELISIVMLNLLGIGGK